MQKVQKKPSGEWSTARVAGLLLAVIGIAVAAYGLYGMFNPDACSAQYQPGNYTGAPAFNRTGFSQYGQQGAIAMGRSGIYVLIIGVLAALLGAMTMKYAVLKTASERRQQ